MENKALRELAIIAVKAKALGHDVFVNYSGHVDDITVHGYSGGYGSGVKIQFDGLDMCFVDVANYKGMTRLSTTLSELTSWANYDAKTLEVCNLVADIYELARKLSANHYHTFVYYIPHVNRLEVEVYFGKWEYSEEIDLTLGGLFLDVDWLKSVKTKLTEILQVN